MEPFIPQTDDISVDDDQDVLSAGDVGVKQDGSLNGNPETEDKENTNGTTADDTQAGRWENKMISPRFSFYRLMHKTGNIHFDPLTPRHQIQPWFVTAYKIIRILYSYGFQLFKNLYSPISD